MSPLKVIFINLILAIVVIVFFSKKRKNSAPSKLNLKRQSKPNDNSNSEVLDKSKYSNFDDATFTGQFQGKDLNIVFNFNGHTFDAYEVLGLPAGSSLESVEKAYQSSKAKGLTQDYDLLEAAYHAIKSTIQK